MLWMGEIIPINAVKKTKLVKFLNMIKPPDAGCGTAESSLGMDGGSSIADCLNRLGDTLSV